LKEALVNFVVVGLALFVLRPLRARRFSMASHNLATRVR
jgi:hypothetical protein